MTDRRITLSVIKADVGGFVGHCTVHPSLIGRAQEALERLRAAGFQIHEGLLEGPVDMFGDPSFDRARETANTIADYMRRHGPFEPHRLPLEEMENTTLPAVLKKLSDRFEVEGD